MKMPYLTEADVFLDAIFIYVVEDQDREYSGLYTRGEKYPVVNMPSRPTFSVSVLDDDRDDTDPWRWINMDDIISEQAFISYDSLSEEDKFLFDVGGLDALLGE